MRKWMALTTIFALLMVSSAPVVSAAGYFMPESMSDMPSMNDQNGMSAMAVDFTTDCIIECGCKLQRDLDALTHLLAPHATSFSEVDAVVLLADVLQMDQSVLESRLLPFQLPPPRHI
ncbi:MAG: hypothetical protein R8K53_07845 [Mariprofundaceae bacterium]